jgi:predicted MPP superfamily phosphohydrolase
VLRLGSQGRGTGYSRLRGLTESVLRVAYANDWPARAWRRFPRACEVEVVRAAASILPRGSETLRIGFVSDIHLGPTTPEELVDAAFAALRAAAPEVLLLGGDYVFLDADARKAERLAALVAGVGAAQKLFVLGNHDLWTKHALLERALERVGARSLVNGSLRLREGLVFVGLDDPWTGKPEPLPAFEGTRAGDALVVLCHAPEGLPLALRHIGDRRAVYLCGHTHGGHVSTPFGPIVVPGRIGRRYPHGAHRLGTTELFVSRGIGGIEVPIRTYARPEVLVLDLVASA